MSEGNVYLCNWINEGGLFKIWLDKDPKLCSCNRDFGEAYDQLWGQVCEKYGDGEAYLEFASGLPANELISRFGNQEIVKIVGNAKADGPINFNDCYSGGTCSFCGKPLGPRNSIAGVYRSIPSGGGSFTKGAFLHLFSERFINLLSDKEREGLKLSMVERMRKVSSSIYYELVGTAIAGYVGARNLSGLKGWQCPVCNARSFGYYIQDFPVHTFVARSDLPSPVPSCFVIGSSQEGLKLCMTMKRWKELVRCPERKGLVGGPMGIVEDRDLERRPALPLKKPGESPTGS